MPKSWQDKIANILRNYQPSFQCSEDLANWGDCWIPGDCSSVDLPEKLTLKLDGNITFSIPINNLLQYDKKYKQCVLEIASIGEPSRPSIRMGDPFFKSFYSIYDVPNRRIGLALSSLAPDGSEVINGVKPVPPSPGPPSPSDGGSTASVWNIWTQFLIILLLILIGLIIALLCYMRHLKKINEEERTEVYDDVIEQDVETSQGKKQNLIEETAPLM